MFNIFFKKYIKMSSRDKSLRIADLLSAFPHWKAPEKNVATLENDLDEICSWKPGRQPPGYDGIHGSKLHLENKSYELDLTQQTVFLPNKERLFLHNFATNDSDMNLNSMLSDAKRNIFRNSSGDNSTNERNDTNQLKRSDSHAESKSPVVLRYQHRMNSNPFRSLPEYNIFAENSMDSVDFVVEANRPENLKLLALKSLSPILNSASCKTKAGHSSLGEGNENCKIDREHSWLDWEVEYDKILSGLKNISGNEDNSFIYSVSSSDDSSIGENESGISTPQCERKFIYPEIYRNAYIEALKQARVRHFSYVPFNMVLTKAFVFSYFNLLHNKNAYEKRNKVKFRGMETIFGNVNVDEYILTKDI